MNLEENKPILILDANAFIGNSEDVLNLRMKYNLRVTPSIIPELKDQNAKKAYKLAKPFLKKIRPDENAIKKVRKFAKKTGDLVNLSSPDIEIIAGAVHFLIENEKEHLIRKKPKQLKNKTGSKKKSTVKKDKFNDGWISTDNFNFESNSYSGGWIGPENIQTMNAKIEDPSSEKKENKIEDLGIGICTKDFAMQNVSLQMGIPLIALDGMCISKVKSYVNECFSCNTIDKDCEKKFCKKCGKDTMARVTCEYSENGELILFRKKNYQYKKRGVRFNIPEPKGGRRIDDLLLTEDSFKQPKVISYLRKQKHHDKQNFEAIEENMEFGFEDKKKNKNFFDLKVGYGRKNPNVNGFWKKKKH